MLFANLFITLVLAAPVDKTILLKQTVARTKTPYASMTLENDPNYGDSDEIEFECKDGYTPTVPLALLKERRGFLAVREKGRKEGFTAMMAQGRGSFDPGPFYIVWEEKADARAYDVYPYPYQVVKMRLIRFREKYKRLYPDGASDSVMAGFRTFKNQCLRCHSVNQQGGVLGPELNIPKNVTEYWSREHLLAFISNASDYHLKSKMPKFAGTLADDEIKGVVRYLEYMSSHKITP